MRRCIRSITCPIMISMTLAGCMTPDAPKRAGDPVEGRRVAFDQCASCHAPGLTGDSANPMAPPLRTVLARYPEDRLERDLNDAVHIAHLKMPQFFFGDEHAADLVAYLRTINQKP